MGWEGIIGVALAHEGGAGATLEGATNPGLIDQVTSISLNSVYIASLIVIALLATAVIFKPQSETFKNLLFWPIVIAVSLSTIVMAASTVYLNNVSYSKGPVHWHADFEIWGCGQEYDLVNPKGFSNKIGTPVLHEHNDKRIHLEGVVVNLSDASLGNFFKAIGGELANESVTLPTEKGNFHRHNDDLCGSKPAQVQVFAISIENKRIIQRKLVDPVNYVYAPQSKVPPGDCIIIEFDTPKSATDKLCRSYQAALERGEVD